MTQPQKNDFLPIVGKIMTQLGDSQLSEENKDIVLGKLNDILAYLNNQIGDSEQQENSEITEAIDKTISESNSNNPIDDAPVGHNGFPTVGEDLLGNVEEKNDNSLSGQLLSNELQKHVLDIKSGIVLPKSDSEKLTKSIDEHDTVRIIGHVTNDGLWNGEFGWYTTDSFYSMASFIWTKASTLFVELDLDREIIEDKTTWDQAYFEKQRNYLRHNFSLERLCHMIMVYDFLHGSQANIEKPSTKPKVTLKKDSRNPFDSDSANNSALPHDSQSQKNKTWLYGGLLFVAIIILLMILFFFCRKQEDKTNTLIPNNQKQETTIQAHSDWPQQTESDAINETIHQHEHTLETNSETIESEGNTI